jgi:hypothetical protein
MIIPIISKPIHFIPQKIKKNKKNEKRKHFIATHSCKIKYSFSLGEPRFLPSLDFSHVHRPFMQIIRLKTNNLANQDTFWHKLLSKMQIEINNKRERGLTSIPATNSQKKTRFGKENICA